MTMMPNLDPQLMRLIASAMSQNLPADRMQSFPPDYRPPAPAELWGMEDWIMDDTSRIDEARNVRPNQFPIAEVPLERGDLRALRSLTKAKHRLREGQATYEQLLQKQRSVEGLQAAVRDSKTGNIYTGTSHEAAGDRVPYSADATDPNYGIRQRTQKSLWENTDDVGFVTNTGEFISRDEANEQMGILTMEDARDLRRR